MILQGHILDNIPKLKNKSISAIVTSPPYWGLRDYGEEAEAIWGENKKCMGMVDGEGHKFSRNGFCLLLNDKYGECDTWKGQLGLEPYLKDYIDHLVEIFEKLKPKLRDDGSLWVNLGDTYFGGNLTVDQPKDWKCISTKNKEKYSSEKFNNFIKQRNLTQEISDKSLSLIPQRFVIAMADKGWIVRNDNIWYKTNPTPTSAEDRSTVDFENVYHFVKKKKYYYHQQINRSDKGDRNKRTVWKINNKGYPGAHFAVFPKELVKIPIDATVPKKICPFCDKPSQIKYKTIDLDQNILSKDANVFTGTGKTGHKKNPYSQLHKKPKTKLKYIVDKIIECNCGGKWQKGIVLDPFFGSGTVGEVAEELGVNWIGIEINPKYISIAENRIKEARERIIKNKKISKQQNRL